MRLPPNTLQAAIATPDKKITYPYRQPAAFANAIGWPTEFVIEYLEETGGFRAGFTGFAHHEAS